MYDYYYFIVLSVVDASIKPGQSTQEFGGK